MKWLFKLTQRIVLVFFLLLSFGLVTALPVQAATTIYVDDDNCPGPGTGSIGDPYCSIQDAIDAASGGDTIMVAAGTYQENLAAWKDMEITKSLTLIGAGSGVTVVELTEGKANGVEIRQTSYDAGNPLDVTIEGMTFTKASGNTNATNRGLKIGETQSAINSLTLRDVEISYAAVNNVEICSPSDIGVLTIENSNFHDAGSHGLMSPGGILSGTITDTHFDNNGRLDVWASGMHLFGGTSDLSVTDCTMNNNGDAGFNGRELSNVTFRNVTASNNSHPGGGHGIAITEKTGSSSDITLENITAENNGKDGILIWTWYDYCSISDVTITGGLFTNNGRAGISVTNWPASGDTGGTIENITVTHAQIENNPNTGVWFELDYGSSNANSSHVNCNNIVGNGGADTGVANTGDGTLDAANNWWGDASGPSGEGPGSGDGVSTDVTYVPWLPTKFQYCPECGGTPPSPEPPIGSVGGEAYPVDKVGLIIPWIALAMVIAAGGIYLIRRTVHN